MRILQLKTVSIGFQPGRPDWANFRLMGDSLLCAVFLNYISNQNGLPTLFHCKIYVLILTKNELGYISGDFFTNSSSHPDSSCQCVVCDEPFTPPKQSGRQSAGKICPDCLSTPQKVAAVLSEKLSQWDRRCQQLQRVCGSCAGSRAFSGCRSFDCPVLYQRVLADAEQRQVPVVQHLLSKALPEF
jgi:hypothetical protein